MHGLIWGVLRLDDREVSDAEADRLSRKIRNNASIGEVSTKISGPLALCRADLCPTGSDVKEPCESVLNAGSISAVVDGRFFSRRDQQTPPIAQDVAERIAEADFSALGEVHGDFAAAVWDGVSARLTLARDVLGVRPLFFAHRPGEVFAFCSLSDPLIRAGFASTRRNFEAIAKMMVWRFGTGTATLLADVHRVPAAHVVHVEAGQFSLRRYWHPSNIKPIDGVPDAAKASRQLKQYMTEAVRRRTPKQGMAATHCSGGLDSATITKLAADQMAADGRKVLAGFVSSVRPENADSVDNAASVEALRQQNPNIEITRTRWPSASELMLTDYSCDRPMSDSPETNPWFDAFAEAGERGIPVLLSGYGGDETVSFNGAGGVTEALQGLDLKGLAQAVARQAEIEKRPGWQILGREVAHKVLPDAVKSAIKGRSAGPPTGTSLMSYFLTPEFQSQKPLEKPARAAKDRRHIGLFDGRLAWSAETLALQAARYGVAPAFPFFDRDVIEFTMGLPAGYFWRDGQRRWLIREAMDGDLPDMIRTRADKGIYSFDIVDSIVEQHAALGQELDRLSTTDVARLFDIPKMRHELQAVVQERQSQGPEADPSQQSAIASVLMTAMMIARFAAG